jgi:thioredoxin reductase (NADPH)
LICDEIYLDLLVKQKNVKIMKDCIVTEILGKEKVTGLRVKDRATKKEKEISLDGVFIYAGLIPRNALAKKIGAKINEKGFVIVDEKMQTTVKGLFAAGDITGNLAQVVWAAAEGAKAAISIHDFLKGIWE